MGNCMGRSNNAVEVVSPQASMGELDELPTPTQRDAKPRNDEALVAESAISLPGAVDTDSPPPELLAITGAAQIAASFAPQSVPVPSMVDSPTNERGGQETADSPEPLDSVPVSMPPPAPSVADEEDVGDTGRSKVVDEEDAAITIQRWWCGNRDQSLTSLCLAFQSIGLTSTWAKSVAFDELALCLQRDDLLQVISMLLKRLADGQPRARKGHGLGFDSDEDADASCGDDDDEDDDDELIGKLDDANSSFITEPSRVLLSAYVVCTHPEVVFAESNLRSGTRQEQELRSAANEFVGALEMLTQTVTEGATEEAGKASDHPIRSRREEVAALVERFQTVWSEYQRRFKSWKRSSTAFLTDELVAAYLELEAAKIAADGTEGGLVTSIGALPVVLDGTEDHLLDDRGLDEDDTDDDGRAGTDDDRQSGDGTDGCLDEIEARQNTIRQAIARNGTAAELKLQQALDQYSSTQQAANAQLAHEIILNPDLQLLPARDPDMLRVRGIATRAFWTSVRDEVRAAAEGRTPGSTGASVGAYDSYGYGFSEERDHDTDHEHEDMIHDGETSRDGRNRGSGAAGNGPPRFGRVLSLLTEVREGLIGLTTNTQFTEDVCDALDIDFLQQQMEHGSLNNEDVLKLLRFVVEKIIELDAPAYEDDSRAWLAGLVDSLGGGEDQQGQNPSPSDFAQFVVEIFAWLFAKLEQIRVGVANFHLRSLSAVLRSHGVEYEQVAFAQQLGRGDQTMQLTLDWLRETIDEEALDISKLNNGDIKEVASAPKLGVVRLCLKSTALVYDECPEVLRMDLMRLLTFQNQAQRLAVVGATIVVLQQVLTQHGLADLTSADDETGGGSLSDTLYVSLQRPEIRLPALIDHVVKVADTHVRHMRLLRRARGEPEQENQTRAFNKDQLRRMLEVTVSPSNPVFMLVMKRVGKALRSFILDRTIAENTKDTGGLDAVMSRVRQLAVNVASLADHNHKVHAQRYTQLVRHVVRQKLDSQH